MVRRFVVFTIIEEALVMGLMAWSYMTYAESPDPWAEVALVASFGVALAFSNAAVFLQGRDYPWGSLRFSKRLRRVGIAIVTTFAIFLVAFACLSLCSSLGFMALLVFSLMAALGIGVWALIGTELSRESVIEVLAIRGDEPDGGFRRDELTLKQAVSLIEEDADDAWLRQPRALRRMLVSVWLNDGKYSVEEAVLYLRGIVEGVGRGDGIAIADVARWVDFLFADVLVADIMQRAGEWRENADEITGLLCDAERRIVEAAPSGGFAPDSSRFFELGGLSLLQRIQAYICIAYSFVGSEADFRSRLDEALGNVEANVEVILGCEAPLALAMLESTVGWGCYDPHARCWTAPLAILAHAAEAIGRERDLSESYKRYVRFLEERAGDTNALGGILLDAKITLARLQCDEDWTDYPDLPIHV